MHPNLNRRKTERIRKRLPILYGSKNKMFKAHTMDISTDGLSIKTHHVFAPRTPLTLQLMVDGNSLSAKGEVRWAKKVPPDLLKFTNGGMGLRFTMKSDQVKEFFKALQFN